MRGWEYRTTTDPADLEPLGREGWELVSVAPRGTALVHYLRRSLPTLAERVTLEQRDRIQRSPTPGRRGAAGTQHRGILNPELLALVGRAGHTDSITICDRGFPVPVGPRGWTSRWWTMCPRCHRCSPRCKRPPGWTGS